MQATEIYCCSINYLQNLQYNKLIYFISFILTQMQCTFETKAAELVGIAGKNDCQTEVCILFIHIQTCI